jgi:hypothetical protein
MFIIAFDISSSFYNFQAISLGFSTTVPYLIVLRELIFIFCEGLICGIF